MFVVYELKVNKSELMKELAKLVKRSKDPATPWCEWTSKDGQKHQDFLSNMSKGQILSMLWSKAKRTLVRYNTIMNQDIEAEVSNIKSEQAKEVAKKIINNIKTIDDFKAALPQLKIGRKTWWKIATEANIDDKVKRYGYGRLTA